jgi:hypothetical protein
VSDQASISSKGDVFGPSPRDQIILGVVFLLTGGVFGYGGVLVAISIAWAGAAFVAIGSLACIAGTTSIVRRKRPWVIVSDTEISEVYWPRHKHIAIRDIEKVVVGWDAVYINRRGKMLPHCIYFSSLGSQQDVDRFVSIIESRRSKLVLESATD